MSADLKTANKTSAHALVQKMQAKFGIIPHKPLEILLKEKPYKRIQHIAGNKVALG